jgi:L-ascorbate metabolism protein UlaG (beta-lactamase superfamily)
MKIKKIGHCCLVIEVGGKRIMTDPGGWTSAQVEERNIDIILITHEHGDHLHTGSLKQVLENNPGCKVVTNSAVKNILIKENIWVDVENEEKKFFVLEDGEVGDELQKVLGINLFAKTCDHADIYDGIVPVQNTGFLLADRMFYPGDAYLEIDQPVEILALPVAGPWAKIREVIEYAPPLNTKPPLPSL